MTLPCSVSGGAGARPVDAMKSTGDVGAARAWLAERYAAHELRCDDQSNGFRFIHASVPIKHGTANLLQYGSSVDIEPEVFPDFYMLEMPLVGGVDLTIPSRPTTSTHPGCALFIPPQVSFASHWRKSTQQFMLKLNASDVQQHWRALVQDETTHLPPVVPVIDFDCDEGWRVQQTLLLLKAEFERCLTSGRDLVSTSPVSSAVLDSVLDYIRIRYRETYDAESHVPLPGPLVKALSIIRHRFADDLSIMDLARASGISERSMFSHFAEFLGTSPMRYLEQKRLEHARGLLLQGKGPVHAAARASGFRHMGRFSCSYKRTFGEKPSHTLSAQ